MNSKTQYISQMIRQYVNTVDSGAEVILFGSRARGDERKESDWDILILTDYAVDIETERNFRYKLYDLELETGEAFSVFVYSKSDWKTKHYISPFYHNINQEGVRI